ncbi:hypothetical protein F3Y22_tig00112632pilonHSYRG00027 [Hibiscus syriacus]|uniref:Uncharacterized protein n=1 Tax=Hibiscus syriacus TaxID=106335 RepID=A0A6A2Y4Q9_HIBSY|nr:hypothetical protein F3Y22_tig00112632pilonHSYRG00027 [Hibiscus syriacus]
MPYQQGCLAVRLYEGEAPISLLSESEVWEVQYDRYTRSSNISNISSARILPIMICSEDGILAVIGQGEEPLELLAEPCAINSFDIDKQNPSDVIFSLEWESMAILTRNFNQSVLLECLRLLDMWHTEHDRDKAKTHSMTEHHQGLVFEGGGEKNGRVVGIVGIGGIASFGRVGNVGMLGSGGRAPGLGNDGCVVGNVGMLGSGGRALGLGNDGCIVGNVGCGRLGIDGRGGSTTPGNVGGIWRRRRAATPTMIFDNDKAMIMAKKEQLVEAISGALEPCTENESLFCLSDRLMV